MTEVIFNIDGPVVPKARARKGVKGRFYTPGQSRAFEERVRWLALRAKKTYEKQTDSKWPFEPHGSYGLKLHVHTRDAKTKDLDNILKSVADALNGVLYPDDRLIDEVHMTREKNAGEEYTTVMVRLR